MWHNHRGAAWQTFMSISTIPFESRMLPIGNSLPAFPSVLRKPFTGLTDFMTPGGGKAVTAADPA